MIHFSVQLLSTTRPKSKWPKFSKKSIQWSNTKSLKKASLTNFILNSTPKMSTATSKKLMKWNRTVMTILKVLQAQWRRQRVCLRLKLRNLRSDLLNLWKDLPKAYRALRLLLPNLITFLCTKDLAKRTKRLASRSAKVKNQLKESKDQVNFNINSGGYPINLLESPITKENN